MFKHIKQRNQLINFTQISIKINSFSSFFQSFMIKYERMQNTNFIEIEKFIKKKNTKAKLEAVPDEHEGHIATNLLIIEKNSKIEEIQELFKIKKTERIGGFLNIHLDKNVLKNINFEYKTENKNEKVNVEFCSANPNGPVHLAHIRGTVFGDSIASILKHCGFDVTREYYVNDQGNQMNLFIESVKYWKYGAPFELHYPGEYVKNIANSLNSINKEEIVQTQVNEALSTLKKMHIEFDKISYESAMYNDLEEVLAKLKEMDLIYEGELEGQKEEGIQLLIKTESLGDQKDRVLRRANGQYTYFAFDMAYHWNKLKRGFKKQIIVLGEDHAAHIDKLKLLLVKFGIDLQIVKISTVSVTQNGEKIAMSKREGKFVTLEDLLEKIKQKELRSVLLAQKVEKTMSFEIGETKSSNLFFIEYSIERCQKLFDFNFDQLITKLEKNLVKVLNEKINKEDLLKTHQESQKKNSIDKEKQEKQEKQHKIISIRRILFLFEHFKNSLLERSLISSTILKTDKSLAIENLKEKLSSFLEEKIQEKNNFISENIKTNEILLKQIKELESLVQNLLEETTFEKSYVNSNEKINYNFANEQKIEMNSIEIFEEIAEIIEHLKKLKEFEENCDLNLLESKEEDIIFKNLFCFESFLKNACDNIDPHRLMDYSLKIGYIATKYINTVGTNLSKEQKFLLHKVYEALSKSTSILKLF